MKKKYYEVVVFESGEAVDTMAAFDNRLEAEEAVKNLEGDVRIFEKKIEVTKDTLRNIALEYMERIKEKKHTRGMLLWQFYSEMERFYDSIDGFNDEFFNYANELYDILKRGEYWKLYGEVTPC